MSQSTWAYVVVISLIALVILRFVVWPLVINARIRKIERRYSESYKCAKNSTRDELDIWKNAYLLQAEKVEPESREYRDLSVALGMSTLLAAYSRTTFEKRCYTATLQKLGHPLLGKAGNKAAEKLCVERYTMIYGAVSALEDVDLARSFNSIFPGAIQQKLSVNDAEEIKGLVHNRFEDATVRKSSRIIKAGTNLT